MSSLPRALAPGVPAAGGVSCALSTDSHVYCWGDDAYGETVNARVFATLADKARRALAAGQSAIVDAVLSRPHERALMEQSAAALGVPCFGLFLHAELATRVARVRMRARDASDADAEVARRQESYDLGTLEWRRIDASGTPDETLARARAALPL